MAVIIKKKGEAGMKIYRFGPGLVEGSASMKAILGGKGANLAEMASLGIPVPPGFTIPCKVSMDFQKVKQNHAETTAFGDLLRAALKEGLSHIIVSSGGVTPLLSVRSGARVSMPGMMDTILNIGITSETLPFWKERLGDRAALDCYRRLIQMFSSVALGVPVERFEDELALMKQEAGVSSDSELDASKLDRLVSRYLDFVESAGLTFPDTLEDQLILACVAVFKSWDNPRAIEYRKIHGYSDDWGTAVNVQAMVFGNRDDKSATGVLFTRCPSTGSPGVVGEFLVNAQGEDVVAGIRTPEPLHSMAAWDASAYHALKSIIEKLEEHYKDMQDVEFTVEAGKLYILQTRSGKRTPRAAFAIAHDLHKAGLITLAEALGRVSSKGLFDMMTDTIDPAFKTVPNLVGIAAGGGVVSGVATFDSEAAVEAKVKGFSPVLIRKETDPDDIAGMNASVGILTATGGLTSHAAVVARGMNKSCVVGATALEVHSNYAMLDGFKINPGDLVTLDGATGKVWVGVKVPVIKGGASPEAMALIVKAAEAKGFHLRAACSDFTTKGLTASVNVGAPVYFDTAVFDTLPASAVAPAMDSLGYALLETTYPAIIDLTHLSEVLPPVDNAFSFMFGLDNEVTVDAHQVKLNSMLAWHPEVTSRCSVVGVTSAKDSAKLSAAGFSVVSHSVATVADLLAAKGPVSVSPEVISTVFGTQEAYATVVKMIEGMLGVSLGSGKLPTPCYWFAVLEA